MKISLYIALLWLASALETHAGAGLAHRLDSILGGEEMLGRIQLGLAVWDLEADSSLYERGPKQMLRPASTEKLYTAITALDRLGGSYQLGTRMCYTGTIADRTLTGDLWLVGGFDPMATSDDIRAFAESLRQMGVDTIRGRIMADKSMLTSDRLGQGWCWDDDNPTLSPLLVGRKDRFVERTIECFRAGGIAVEALTAEGTCPANAYHISTRTHTIDQVLMRMMKESDNLYAEALFFQLAADAGHRPAGPKQAAQIVRRTIAKAAGGEAQSQVADGSGLSLYNYTTVREMTAMLRYAWRAPHIFTHLEPALPLAGSDGTLAKRMRGTAADGNVRAKTGTLTGISSLAGYCTAPDGHRLAFAIICQGVMHAGNAKRLQDRICRELCRTVEGSENPENPEDSENSESGESEAPGDSADAQPSEISE